MQTVQLLNLEPLIAALEALHTIRPDRRTGDNTSTSMVDSGMGSTTGTACAGTSWTAASRSIALTRENALFAGHDMGAASWATAATLIETGKLDEVDPLAWMTDVLTKLVNRWPASKIEHLMPWPFGLGLMPWAWGEALTAGRDQNAA